MHTCVLAEQKKISMYVELCMVTNLCLADTCIGVILWLTLADDILLSQSGGLVSKDQSASDSAT